MADALVHGKAICIQGGDYRLGRQCDACGQWAALEAATEVSCNCQRHPRELEQQGVTE